MAEPLPKSVRIFAIVWTGLVAMTTVGWFGVWLAVRDGKPQTDLWKSALLYGLLGVPVGTLGTAKATRSLKMRDDPEAQLVEQRVRSGDLGVGPLDWFLIFSVPSSFLGVIVTSLFLAPTPDFWIDVVVIAVGGGIIGAVLCALIRPRSKHGVLGYVIGHLFLGRRGEEHTDSDDDIVI